jgi:hypothetical protein
MKKRKNKLTTALMMLFSCTVFSEQYECSCCHLVENESCALAPSIAPSIDIKFDFKNAKFQSKLFVIEKCSNPFEITRKKTFIRGTTNIGELRLVLCNKDQLMAIKTLNITDNYSSLCKISEDIVCEIKH